MTTKHTPATPLPLDVNWRAMFDAEHSLTQRLSRDRVRLVKALRGMVQEHGAIDDVTVVARALLAELGE